MTDGSTPHIHIDDLPEKCRQIVSLIGFPAFLAMVEEYGGEFIYLPKIDTLSVASRNRAIQAEFNGRNHSELSKKYRLSTRWIREIVAGSGTPSRENSDGQRTQTQLTIPMF